MWPLVHVPIVLGVYLPANHIIQLTTDRPGGDNTGTCLEATRRHATTRLYVHEAKDCTVSEAMYVVESNMTIQVLNQ